MKDLHCHILYGIDDGAKTINDSINILKHAYNDNITDIVLTPHYIENTKYNTDNKKKKELLEELKKIIKKENININLYLGNEVMICNDILKLINEKKIHTINNSRYVLIEFPMFEYNKQIEKYNLDILFELISNGYIPIIAHPERYRYIQKDINIIDKYIDMGILFQGNYRSLLGYYGRKSKITLKKLLKKGYIKILASDIHHSGDYEINKSKLKTLKIVKDSKIVNDLYENNFDKIINNEDIY